MPSTDSGERALFTYAGSDRSLERRVDLKKPGLRVRYDCAQDGSTLTLQFAAAGSSPTTSTHECSAGGSNSTRVVVEPAAGVLISLKMSGTGRWSAVVTDGPGGGIKFPAGTVSR